VFNANILTLLTTRTVQHCAEVDG